MIWMCPIVDKIKKKFDEITNYNIEIEEDKKKIEEIANEILEYYNQDGKVEIIKIATDMGFQVFTSSFKDKLVSGFISISNENIKKYKFAKIMKINRDENVGHRRFTVAHEIGHYLFDYNDKTGKKYLNATYRTDDVFSIKESRACYFAACLLLPRNLFLEKYNQYQKAGMSNFDLVETMANDFGVSTRTIVIRFDELNILFWGNRGCYSQNI